MDFIENNIISSIEKLGSALKTALAKKAEALGLSLTQGQIIIHIEAGTTQLSGIAKKMGVSSATISESIKNLKNKGILEKIENTRDNRSKIISLNEKGKEAALTLKNYNNSIKDQINKLHMSDRAVLLEILHKLI